MTAKELRRLADQIRTAIDTASLSRYEISKRSGVDEATLSRFVNEKSSLSLDAIEKVALVLDLQIVVKQRRR